MNDIFDKQLMAFYKIIFIFSVAFFLCSPVFAQEPAITWQQCYGGSEWDGNNVSGSSLVLLEDAYVFIAQSLSNDGQVSGNHGQRDIWFVKIGLDGGIIWQHSLGGSSDEYPAKLITTSDGGFLILGSTGSNDGDVSGQHGWLDYWAVKTNGEGNILWQNCLGGSYNDEPYDVLETEDGGFLIIGYTNSSDGDVSLFYGFWDIWVVKLDAIGELLWDRSYGGSLFEYGNTIKPDNNGGYVIGGTVASSNGLVNCNQHGMEDLWLLKLDENMDIVWQKCYGGTYSDGGTFDIVVLDDGFLLSSTTSSNDGDVSGLHGMTDDQPDIWVVRVDGFGEILWQRCLGGAAWDVGNSVAQTSDGGFIVVGYSNSISGDLQDCNHGPYFDAWVVKLSPQGDIIWRKCLGGDVYQRGDDIVFTGPGHMLILGTTGPDYTGGDVDCDLHGKNDIWLVELFDTITGTNEYQTYTSGLSVFPNPARDYVVFELKERPKKSIVQISNVFGDQVEVLFVKAEKTVWDTRQTKSGIYFYRAEVDGEVLSGKIVIQK
jgi:hypothetical protein